MNEEVELCDMEVGIHKTPYWLDRESSQVVCDHHKRQLEQRPEGTGFVWEKLPDAEG